VHHGRDELTPARQSRRRHSSGTAFAGFLAASIAAHAAVFGVLPGPQRDSSPAVVTLEVVLSVSATLPVSQELLPPQRPQARAEPKRRPPDPRLKARVERPADILAVPDSRPEEPRPFALEAAVPGPDPVAPPLEEQTAQVAVAAVTPPVFNAAYLRNPSPSYPLAARRAGEQGTVLLRVLVTREGVAARVEVEKSSGSLHLDTAALETVKAWRFTPARRGADAIESWVRVPVVFRLEGPS
jgi:protein TonB